MPKSGAKRLAARRTKSTGTTKKRPSTRRSGKRLIKKAQPRRKAAARKKAPAPRRKLRRRARPAAARKTPRLDRARRTFEETIPMPPSSPGGDNPSPDLEVVDDIGKALGVEYADNEELKAADKVVERDKHRWELDPASSEDYKDRK